VGFYSIKELEDLSGIKAHTIRIWEQRYSFIAPNRTGTNIRYYDDKDLRLILNISLLKDNGYKISKIADMSEKEMQEAVLNITEKNLKYADQIHTLVLAMVDVDEDRFEKIISTNTLKIGFEKTMINIVYPFLSKIGVLWQTGSINPAQEHFISNLIRRKLIVATDGQIIPSNVKTNKYLLYLPEGELHEVSLLFADYLIKVRLNRTIYLGQSLPMVDLKEIVEVQKPEYILTIITSCPSGGDVQGYVDSLSDLFPECTILLSGYQVVGQDLRLKENVVIFNRIEEMVDFVEEKSISIPMQV
jgi:DNA-binding transcriptional MerR regulator